MSSKATGHRAYGRPPIRFMLPTLAALLLAACASQAPRPQTHGAITNNDLIWLRRDGFGVDSVDVARYRALGRDGLLDVQLADRVHGQLSPPIASLIHGYEAVHTPLPQLLAGLYDA